MVVVLVVLVVVPDVVPFSIVHHHRLPTSNFVCLAALTASGPSPCTGFQTLDTIEAGLIAVICSSLVITAWHCSTVGFEDRCELALAYIFQNHTFLDQKFANLLETKL